MATRSGKPMQALSPPELTLLAALVKRGGIAATGVHAEVVARALAGCPIRAQSADTIRKSLAESGEERQET